MARWARAVTVVAAWVVATTLVGAVTWTAVSRLGGGNSASVLSPAEVRRVLATASPAASPSRRLIPLGVLRTGKDPALQSQPHTRSNSWQLTGGTVGASCRGSKIRLLYASPRDGWAYRLESLAVSSLAVGFTRGQARADLEARCAGGVPTRVDEPEADDQHERD